ncbi:MAG: Holliday junction resolvase RuvX [Candidatus Pacebacteria bacterium CG_4_10_14_0_8_um_filter_43_12]|nr:MAG: Holliday junction resolvase RuvX [Candidatus Pacebacteria bacterium CG10_big_fil_rev_8_21_14_0_10_44_11]PIY79019.1 MAG: Holliday junction resolvase RuvX [Candidatus Pacebacteria bacterium CG_4_10_14_0_8_um_filter_43_12]
MAGKLKVLAIDFGTVRIGLALSYGTLADPLTIIPNDNQAISYICKLIMDYQVNTVVVGISENEMAKKSQQFVDRLRQVISTPIILTDETLSTKTVRSKLAEQKKSQKRPVDHLAAAEFLQEWLDTQPQ